MTINELARMVADGFNHVEERFNEVDERFDKVDARFDRLEGRMGGLEGRMDTIVIPALDSHAHRMKRLEGKLA